MDDADFFRIGVKPDDFRQDVTFAASIFASKLQIELLNQYQTGLYPSNLVGLCEELDLKLKEVWAAIEGHNRDVKEQEKRERDEADKVSKKD